MKLEKKNYTLLEIIAAMAVFLIVCLVVIRFFGGARELAVVSNNNNEMHANARAFFDIIGNDLRSVVYNNTAGTSGTMPFVHAYYPIDGSSPFSGYIQNIREFYEESLIPANYKYDMAFGSGKRDYVPLLCFMANPSIIPAAATSPLAEIRYTFVPAGTTSAQKANFTNYPPSPTRFSGGKILRGVTHAASSMGAGHPFNSESCPLVDAEGAAVSVAKDRIKEIFGDSSSFAFEELIGNVYRMNISCYKLELVDSGGKKIYRYAKIPMYNLRDSLDVAGRKEFDADKADYMTWPPYDPTSPVDKLYRYADGSDIELPQLGHPLPDLIKVDLYMLSPRDWDLLMSYYNWNSNKFNDEIAAKKLLDTKLRRFSRTFHINDVDVSNL